jgi:holliday junction DNA helicase RuvB
VVIKFSVDPQPTKAPSPKPTPKPKPHAEVLNPQATPADEASGHDTLVAPSGNPLRPTRLADYVGQSHIKEALHITIGAAKVRREPLDHLLFYGPPGLGKTTLSMILAHEMGTHLHLASAPGLERPRDIIGLLHTLEDGDILFIDEIHRLNRVTEEILYPAMEDYRLDMTIGKGPTAKTLQIPLPRFTLIGATTKAGALSSPLRDRFGHAFRLTFYTPQELQLILHHSAQQLGSQLDDAAAGLLATACRGTPRIANRLLKRVRDAATVHHHQAQGAASLPPSQPLHISHTVVVDTLTRLGVTDEGLDAADRALLSLLCQQFNGGPVGLETLAASLGEDVQTLEDVTEPFLLQQGYLARTPRGRQLTPKGHQLLLSWGLAPSTPLGLTFGDIS